MTLDGMLSCSGVPTGISGYDVPSAEKRWTTISVATKGTNWKCFGKIVRALNRSHSANIFQVVSNRMAQSLYVRQIFLTKRRSGDDDDDDGDDRAVLVS